MTDCTTPAIAPPAMSPEAINTPGENSAALVPWSPAKTNPPESEREWTLVAEKSTQLVAQRSMTTDLIYTLATRPHTTSRNPVGINALWGDIHVSFSTTKAAFDPSLWDKGEHEVNLQNPGDNPKKFRAIVSLLRP